jgi:hypothetical protein
VSPPASAGAARLSAFERLAGEVIDALKTPFVCGLLELDFSAVHEFRRRMAQERGVRLSDVVVVVSAVSRVLAEDPTLHTVHRRGRRLVPETVDVGVSVAGQGALAPVAIVPDAASMTVVEVNEASWVAVSAGDSTTSTRPKSAGTKSWSRTRPSRPPNWPPAGSTFRRGSRR